MDCIAEDYLIMCHNFHLFSFEMYYEHVQKSLNSCAGILGFVAEYHRGNLNDIGNAMIELCHRLCIKLTEKVCFYTV